MSIKLAENEKVVRTYDYATQKGFKIGSAAFAGKSLIVTNKRVVHVETSHTTGGKSINTQQMPVSAAKYVSTSYNMKPYPIFLVLGLIIAIFSIVGAIALEMPPLFAGLIFAAIFILIFCFKKDLVLSCSFETDTRITHAFGCSTKNGNSVTKGFFRFFRKHDRNLATIYVSVKVNREVAEAMAEELGAVIMAAAAGEYDIAPAAAPAE